MLALSPNSWHIFIMRNKIETKKSNDNIGKQYKLKNYTEYLIKTKKITIVQTKQSEG